ncbi:MAG: citryl-CoA synthetase large subunit [Candidatus Nanohaloarchaea archaeon]
MKLYEYEAKNLLQGKGVKVPENDGERYAVKAQVLTNDRAEHGGIEFAETREEAEEIAEEMKEREVQGHEVDKVLIEERIDLDHEFYIAFLYDTDTRRPVMLFSTEGGSGVENRQISKMVLDEGSEIDDFSSFLENEGVEDNGLSKVAERLYRAFLEEDMRLLEINPMVKSAEDFIVVDAMIELEDDASFRHEWSYPERSVMARDKTEREKRAEKIDEDDHRGVAGKYTELEGDIGMMLAGGGASLTNMDALIEYGGEPANYTEYGGNPPTEKVYKLSKVIMSKPGLKGLWHVGGTANNTDIYRTMKGFCQALEEEKPDYPIVVRRDGPNADKAFELLRETRDKLDLNMKLYRNDTPMTKTAEVLMEMVEK